MYGSCLTNNIFSGVIADINYLKFLLELNVISRILVVHEGLWRRAFMLVTVAVNVFMLATWKAPMDFGDMTPETLPE